jgi:hypothetical protein
MTTIQMQDDVEALALQVGRDFICQIEARMEQLHINREEFALRVGASQGWISQVFKNPKNLSLYTIVKFVRAVGLKVAVVAYDDKDPLNQRGQITPEVFTKCWEKRGKPRDFFDLGLVSGETR